MKTPITIGETTAQCGEKVRGKLLAGEFSTGTEVYLPFIIMVQKMATLFGSTPAYTAMNSMVLWLHRS